MSTDTYDSKHTSQSILACKGQKKIVMLTAYDYPSSVLAAQAGVDILLVGDSLGMTVLGKKDTLSVTLDMMLHHCKAVSYAQERSNASALVVCDMPFLSYEDGVGNALHNAGKLISEGGARAVKLEGGFEILPQVDALVSAGIPVMGHLGLTPQRVATIGGYKVQGKDPEQAEYLLNAAEALQEAGCFSLVLECVPHEVAQKITAEISIPTLGIGAGPSCDGQVLVFHDMLGYNTAYTPKFVKKYANMNQIITEAVTAYAEEVRQGIFPQKEHTFFLETTHDPNASK